MFHIHCYPVNFLFLHGICIDLKIFLPKLYYETGHKIKYLNKKIKQNIPCSKVHKQWRNYH